MLCSCFMCKYGLGRDEPRLLFTCKRKHLARGRSAPPPHPPPPPSPPPLHHPPLSSSSSSCSSSSTLITFRGAAAGLWSKVSLFTGATRCLAKGPEKQRQTHKPGMCSSILYSRDTARYSHCCTHRWVWANFVNDPPLGECRYRRAAEALLKCIQLAPSGAAGPRRHIHTSPPIPRCEIGKEGLKGEQTRRREMIILLAEWTNIGTTEVQALSIYLW